MSEHNGREIRMGEKEAAGGCRGRYLLSSGFAIMASKRLIVILYVTLNDPIHIRYIIGYIVAPFSIFSQTIDGGDPFCQRHALFLIPLRFLTLCF